MKQDIKNIFDYLAGCVSIDFSGYNATFLTKILDKRIADTATLNYQDYLQYLQKTVGEADFLFSALTLQVSEFFRNPLVFNYLSEIVLPSLVEKRNREGGGIRVWSAGCAHGEEAYSLAILLNEIAEQNQTDISIRIFATDIAKSILNRGQDAIFHVDTISNVPYGFVEKYFARNENFFRLDDKITNLVNFSPHDLLDKKTSVPPVSIYGNFDIVCCRNVLIYFKAPFQERIIKNLYNSLALNGFLVLGSSEILPSNCAKYFRVIDDLHIYQRRG